MKQWWPAIMAAALWTASGGAAHARTPAAPAVVDLRGYGGAAGDGRTDDTQALLRCIARARQVGGVVHVPPGVYMHAGTVTLDGVALSGDGAQSVLQAQDPAQAAVILSGSGSALRALRLTGARVAGRLTTPQSAAVWVKQASQFSIRAVTVSGGASAGVFVDNSGGERGRPAVIADCTVSGTRADGIHLTNGSRFVTVARSHVAAAGDDLIAVVSYLDNPVPCREIVIEDNAVVGNTWGRGITVVGGSHIVIARNRITNACGAGLYLAAEDGEYHTYGADHVTALDNKITGSCLHSGLGQAGVHIYGTPAHPTTDIEISGGQVNNSHNSGIYIGQNARGIRLHGIAISGAGKCGVENVGGEDVEMTGLRVQQTALYGIYNGAQSRGNLTIAGAKLSALNRSGQNFVDAILVEASAAGALRTGVTITGTWYTPAQGEKIEHLIECHVSPATLRTVAGSQGGPLPSVYVGP